MLSRRSLLQSATATSLIAAAPALAFAAKPDASSSDLAKLFDTFVEENFDLSPETVTSLGLDNGARAYQKFQLGERSPAAAELGNELAESQLNRLRAVKEAPLSASDKLNVKIIAYGLDNQVTAAKKFKFAGGGAGAPYQINQLGGAYHDIPDFLDSQHQIETKEDAEAYLARLSEMPTAIDQECEQATLDASLGVIPPDFVIDKTLDQLKALLNTPPDKSVLVQSLVRRTKEKKIEGDWEKWATHLLEARVKPALQREITLATSLRAKATHDAGVWRLPNGDDYYRASVRQWTTTDKTGDEIHKIGLDMVAKISADADALMKKQGMTTGTVGERYRAMYDDKKYQYPNTDEGKTKLIADLNERVKKVQALLPKYFGVLPKAGLEIKRIPAYTESGAPGGYYQNGALDGSRPGAYYINLRDTAEQPSWTLPTLTHHEGIPGHHLQITIALEADTPMIRKLQFYSAYAEGWALYAEQLADEMGLYDQDPLGKLGYLHDALFRAVRLVVDSGMHSKKWTREQAIKYMVDIVGDKDTAATTEIERYCVWPGQACGYMLGKIEILRLREEAKAKLGSKFDLRKFHDAILKPGAMPLDVLAQVVDEYVKKG
jgi:uncharacterized protein (DUF885 family)